MRADILRAAIAFASLSVSVSAKAWTFQDATLSVVSKGSGVGGGFKEQLSVGSPLSLPVSLSADGTLKLLLTITEDQTPARPHQAFLLLQEPSSGLEDAFPLTVKESGKAKVDVAFKDLPVQFLQSTAPLRASIVLASFGSSSPLDNHLFDLSIAMDESAPMQLPSKPLRYGKLTEIHHIFRADAQSPPMIITLVFLAIALMTLPALIGVWADLGANLNHFSQAFNSAPVSHSIFLGSIAALEGLFFLYYKDWKLYQMLPAVGLAGFVALLSGSRALSEVQSRRLLGKR